MKVDEFNLPFDEALNYWGSKGLKLNPDAWYKVWQEANNRAFTVAHVSAMDVLVDIKNEVDNAINNGVGFKDFQDSLAQKLKDKGWLKPTGEKAWTILPDGTKRKRLTGWRLETIFRTNLQSAYQVGRYQQMMETVDARPYWQYHAIMDAVTRPTHAAQNGKIYPVNSRFWDTWYPPNGFNCRCYVTSLTKRQVTNKQVETKMPEEKPDSGWQYNVGKTGLGEWKPDFNSLGWDKEAIKIYKAGLKK